MSLRAENLPEAGDAGPEVEPPPGPAGHVLVLGEDDRARPDERHLALQHVEELRQLVEAGAPQEGADPSDARIVRDLEHPRIATGREVHVQVRELVLPRLGVGGHRPELEDPEDLLRPAATRLAEEHRPLRVELDHDGEHEHDGREDQQPERRDDEVEAALQEPRRPREPERRQAHQRNALDRVDADAGTEDVEEPGDDVDLDVEVLDLADESERLVVAIVREGDDHALDVEQLHELAQLVRPTQHRQVVEIVAPLLGLRVDEPDEIDAVLVVVEDLARGQLADVAGADDDRVLQVRRAPVARAAGDRPGSR